MFSDLILDNSKKVELQEENNQDIYVPRFFIPPIQIISIGHAVDVEHAEIKSINEAQVCVDDSFLLKSESPDSESKEMGSMGIERSIASDKKCGPDKDAFGTYDGLKKSECYTMTEELAMTESMERSNESSSESSSLHLKNRRRCASLRQKYEIHGIFLCINCKRIFLWFCIKIFKKLKVAILQKSKYQKYTSICLFTKKPPKTLLYSTNTKYEYK